MESHTTSNSAGAQAGPSTTRLFDDDDVSDDLSVFSASSNGDSPDSCDEPLLDQQQRRRGAAKRMQAVEGLYKGEAVLPTEEFGSLPVLDIYHMIKEGVINPTPDYQREAVWPTGHVTGLLESLLRNMHVPELLFNIYTPADKRDGWYRRVRPAMQIRPEGKSSLPEGWGEESDVEEDDEERVVRQVWNCADGKQRMTAISLFIENKVKVKGENGKSYTYSSFPTEARKVFNTKRLRYGFFRELSDRQEREIFKRVQRGKALDKGEILNSIDSEYADWVRELQTEFLGREPKSLRPRILRGERGAALTAAYQASRNIIVGVDAMKNETDQRRHDTLQQPEKPKRKHCDMVLVGLRRFHDLTCVLPLEGEDRWPDTQVYQTLRTEHIPVPHRVWRLRPEMVPAKRKSKSKRASEAVAFAPVELHILPAVVHHFSELDYDDGDLLEIVELLRIHIHDKLSGEVKDNSKTYDLVKAWIKAFDKSDLTHKYNNDGSLRDGSKRSSTIASFSHSGASASAGASTSGRKPPRNAPPSQDSSLKRSASVAGSVGSAAGSAAKKARTAASGSGLATAERGDKGKGKGKEREHASSADFFPQGGTGGAFALPTQRGSSGRARASPSASPAGVGVMPFGVPPSLGAGGGAVGHYGDTNSSSSTSGRLSAAGADDFALPAARAPAPAPATAGLSEKQRKYAARAGAPGAGGPTRAPPVPAPPAAAPPQQQQKRAPPPPRKGPMKFDERGRLIQAPPSGSAAAGGGGPGGAGGRGYVPPGFGAENDAALAFGGYDAPYPGEVGGGYGAPPAPGQAQGYGLPPAVTDAEIQAAIHARRRAPSGGGGESTSLAQESARAAAATGRRVVSGGSAGEGEWGRVKRDPEDEERGASLALSGHGGGARDGRNEEVQAALAQRQGGGGGGRSGSRQPYERADSRQPYDGRERDREREGGYRSREEYRERDRRDEYRSSDRRDDYRSSNRRDDYRSERRDDYRGDRRDGGYRGEERRNSGGGGGGYDRRDGGYRRDEPPRSQSSVSRLPPDQQARTNGAGYPASPPRAHSSASRFPPDHQPRPNGTGYPPPSTNGYAAVPPAGAAATGGYTTCFATPQASAGSYNAPPPSAGPPAAAQAYSQRGVPLPVQEEVVAAVDPRRRPGQG
ncbi:hypothetical protein JCM10450v2_001606 [Rhodotorula kratochvilovae]